MDPFYYRLDYLPSFTDEDNKELIDYANSFSDQGFISYGIHNDRVVREPTGYNKAVGFSYLDIGKTNFELVRRILDKNRFPIKYDTNPLYFMQRVRWSNVAHTDPGRTVSLIYIMTGDAVSRFYSMDNFVPDINYLGENIRLEHETRFKLNTWYLFNNAAIHEVGFIQDEYRWAFNITLTDIFKDYFDAKENLSKIFST